MLIADSREAAGREGWATALRILAILAFGPSFATLCLLGPTLSLPLAPRLFGLLAALAALPLLYLSLLGEPGRKGSPGRGPLLVRDGTYGLCRHPGVLWLCLFHGGLVLATGSLPLLLALPLWTLLNAASALVEDRVFLPRRFGPAYLAYRAEVPFLIPRGASLIRALKGLGRRPAP